MIIIILYIGLTVNLIKPDIEFCISVIVFLSHSYLSGITILTSLSSIAQLSHFHYEVMRAHRVDEDSNSGPKVW